MRGKINLRVNKMMAVLVMFICLCLLPVFSAAADNLYEPENFAYAWEFNPGQGSQGFFAAASTIANNGDGHLTQTMESSKHNAFLLSPNNLSIDAGVYKYVKIRVRNNFNTPGRLAIQWSTTADTSFDNTWSGPKSYNLGDDIIPADGEFHEYVIDLSGHSGWTGTIVRFRLCVTMWQATETNTVWVDYIRISDTPEIAVSGITAQEPAESLLRSNTDISDAVALLPDTATLTDTLGAEHTVEITAWNCPDYEVVKTAGGTALFTASFELPTSVVNPDGIKLVMELMVAAPANTQALDDKIDSAQELDQLRYTYESFYSLYLKVEEGKALTSAGNAFQSEVDEAVVQIQAAIDALEETLSAKLTAVYDTSADTLTITAYSPVEDSLYQFWVRDSIWILQSAYGSSATLVIEDAFDDNEQAEVLVRVKAGEQSYSLYKSFRAEDYTTKLVSVSYANQSYTTSELIYLPQTGAVLSAQFMGIEASSVSITNGEYLDGLFVMDNFESTGIQTLTVTIDGKNEYLKVLIYDNSADYTYITQVDTDTDGDIAILNAQTQDAGEGYQDYTVTYNMNGLSNNIGQFLVTYPGYYYYFAALKVDAKTTDLYAAYYFREGSQADIAGVATLMENLSSYTIGLDEGQSGYEYQVILHDAYGERIIKNYSSVPSIVYSPSANGTYMFEYRVRIAGSSATYEKRTYITIVHNFKDKSKIGLDIPDTVTVKAVNLITAEYLGENENVLYKFIIHSRGMWKVERNFSPSGKFVFVPPKAGEYTIEVRIIHADNNGYADALVYSQKITVMP